MMGEEVEFGEEDETAHSPAWRNEKFRREGIGAEEGVRNTKKEEKIEVKEEVKSEEGSKEMKKENDRMKRKKSEEEEEEVEQPTSKSKPVGKKERQKKATDKKEVEGGETSGGETVIEEINTASLTANYSETPQTTTADVRAYFHPATWYPSRPVGGFPAIPPAWYTALPVPTSHRSNCGPMAVPVFQPSKSGENKQTWAEMSSGNNTHTTRKGLWVCKLIPVCSII